MKIIEPSCYLSSLGWSVENGDDGSQNLVRLNAAASAEIAQLQSQVFPNTEIDLLSSLIKIGYLPEESFELMEKMSVNRSGIMTTTNLFKPPVTINTKKMDFINTIRSDPLQATKELFTYHYDEETVQQHGYRHHEVDDTNFITYHPMSPPTPEPAPEPSYQYATTHAHIGLDDDPIFSFDVPEHECLDLDNPFDMDRVLGWTQMEAQRGKLSHALLRIFISNVTQLLAFLIAHLMMSLRTSTSCSENQSWLSFSHSKGLISR